MEVQCMKSVGYVGQVDQYGLLTIIENSESAKDSNTVEVFE